MWWVRAEDPYAIAKEFRTLLEILAPNDAAAITDPVSAVHSLLAARSEPWLLIIDNIADPAILRGLVPVTGSGHVLVTSRATTWPNRQLMITVDPLGLDAAADLLILLTGDEDQTSATALAEELGALPLALAQAGSFARFHDLTLDEYLRLYRQKRSGFHRDSRLIDYEKAVAATWQISFDQLSEPAQTLLNLVCWFAADSIPLSSLLNPDLRQMAIPDHLETLISPLVQDRLLCSRATGELVSNSLATRTGPPGAISLHRLVQFVTQENLTGDQASGWITAAHNILKSVLPKPPATASTLMIWNALHTHTHALLSHLNPQLPETLATRGELARWIGEAGDPPIRSESTDRSNTDYGSGTRP